MPEQKIEFETERQLHQLYGESPANLSRVERKLVRLVARGNCLTIEGKPEGGSLWGTFCTTSKGQEQGFVSGKSDFGRFLAKVESGKTRNYKTFFRIHWFSRSGRIGCSEKLGQRRFLDLITNNDMVFGIGPAGTGKTFLAMIAALHALLEGEIQRIVLARPAVEAGKPRFSAG